MTKRLALIFATLLALSTLLGVKIRDFDQPSNELRPNLSTLRTDLSPGYGYTFACPPEQDLCVFIASDTADTTCTAEGWSFNSGTDATLCDNQQFNGHIPDEASRVDRLAGFWTHLTTETAELVWDWEFIAVGAGSGDNRGVAILTAGFGLICDVEVEDLGASDPADIRLVGTTGAATMSNRVTLGADTEFSGRHLQFKLQYNAAAGTCEIWVDHIGAVPGTGAVANVSVTTTASLLADVVIVRNFIGANLVIMRNLAACPDGCTF